jgi:hypothetical protein
LQAPLLVTVKLSALRFLILTISAVAHKAGFSSLDSTLAEIFPLKMKQKIKQMAIFFINKTSQTLIL